MNANLAVGSVVPVVTKPGRLSAERIAELDLARRSDASNDDWTELYRAEFPPEEQRDVEQLRGYVKSGEVILHETRGKSGELITWSMSQDYPATPGTGAPSFWLGCWTVTRRSYQSSGIGRVHFQHVIEALKTEKPGYIGRLTEIESTLGLGETAQPVRRAKFYKSLGMEELDVSYEIPLFQPVGAPEYVPQERLGKGIPGQLLFAGFDSLPVAAQQARSMIRRIYQQGYDVSPTDTYIERRLALIADSTADLRIPIRLMVE